MALVPARREYAISEVDLGIGVWTVIVQVVESHRVQHSSGNRGGQPRPYKRFLLVDQHGTKVSGVLYDKDIEYFWTSLEPFKRYRISNAKLTPAFGFFKVGDYNFTWIIRSETPVELIEETQVPPLPFSYPICPFNEFFHHADREGGFNVKGIAIHAFPQRQVTRDSTIREIVIIDESKQPMILGLWNYFGDVEGKIIADNIANTPLIIGLNMKATTFHGLALGSRPFSYILIDPPLLDTPSLKDWFALNKAEINQLLQDKAYKNANLLLPPPSIADAIDVPTALATLNMVNTAWVLGQVRFTAAKQAYHLVACRNCHRKVNAPAGWNLKCNSCGEYDETELRCRVPMEITGGNQSLHIVMTSPDVEQVTGLTPQMLSDSYEFDFGVQDDLQAALDKLNVLCFIKKYDPATLGAPNTAGMRYTVVKAYRMDDIEKPPASSPSSADLPQLTLPDNEEQLFTPKTKKNMTEVQALPTPEKAEQSTPPSKRSLDFAAAQSGDAPLPTHPSNASSASTNEPADVHISPAKKGKEKQVSN